jgi:hypothetical protein
VYVTHSTGSGLLAPTVGFSSPFYGSLTTQLADVNGDGKADAIAVNGNSIYVMLSVATGYSGSTFGSPQLWLSGSFFGTQTTLFADVNGDGKADGVAINDGDIWVLPSTGTGFGSPVRWLNGAFYGSH